MKLDDSEIKECIDKKSFIIMLMKFAALLSRVYVLFILHIYPYYLLTVSFLFVFVAFKMLF